MHVAEIKIFICVFYENADNKKFIVKHEIKKSISAAFQRQFGFIETFMTLFFCDFAESTEFYDF